MKKTLCIIIFVVIIVLIVNFYQRQAVVEAIYHNDIAAVKKLVKYNPGLVNATGTDACPSSETMLHSAIHSHHKEISKFLIAKGADVNASNTYNQTPLHYAAEWGDVEIIQLLLDKGANPNKKDFVSATSLYGTVRGGHEKAAQLLKKHGAKGTSRLQEAAAFGNAAAVKRILQSDHSLINKPDAMGFSLLYYAVINGHPEVVDVLLANGAKIVRKEYLLHTAVRGGSTKVAQRIIAAGVGVNSLDSAGCTPLHRAVQVHKKIWSYFYFPRVLILQLAAGYTALRWNLQRKEITTT